MNQQEICAAYMIPKKILEEYHAWGLCEAVKDVMAAWQYSEKDVERLSMLMALHDIGFCEDEVRQYMQLELQGSKTEKERASMLECLRKSTLKEIHLRETQLDRLDYLRHEMTQHENKD